MFLSWARRRQFIYGGGVALALLLFFGIPFLPRSIRSPVCTDGRQNGNETGVDCGGPPVDGCPFLCRGEEQEPRIVWQRVFNEGGGVASALLYGENLNTDAGVFDARYYVKVYDFDGVLVAEKEATTAIAPGGAFAAFVPNLFVGERTATRAVFEARPGALWRRDAPPRSALRVSGIQSSLLPMPRVEAVAANMTDSPLDGVFTAILYGASGNALGASQTVVELSPRGSMPLVFVWRTPFGETPVRAEIISAVR